MAAAFSWINHSTTPGLAFTYSVAGSALMSSIVFDAAYPAANMIEADPSKVCRVNYVRNASADGYASITAQFSTTVGGQKSTRVLSALNLRIPAAATLVVVKAYDYLGANVFNQGYNASDLVPIPGTTDRYNLPALHTAAANIASYGILVFVPPSTTDYIEIGHLWGGPALVLGKGIDANWSMGFIDPSEVERARGGALVAQQLPRRRRVQATLYASNADGSTALDYNTSFGTPGTPAALSLRQFALEAGISTPIVVIPRSDTVHALQALGVYGALADLRNITHRGGNEYSTEITAEEIR